MIKQIFIALSMFIPPITCGLCIGYMEAVKNMGNPMTNPYYMHLFIAAMINVIITLVWMGAFICDILEIKKVKEDQQDSDRTESGTTNTP
jgi:hypothetical protein